MRSTTANRGPSRLTLRTLGKLDLSRADAGVKLTAKQKAFLTVLVAHPAGISRDKLGSILWSNHAPRNARHSVSQAIHTIRATLPEIEVIADADVVKLTADIRWDVDVLLKACASNETQKSIRAYNGEFLVGLDEMGHEFEDWRSSIQRKVVNALGTTVVAAINDLSLRGDFSEADNILRALTARLGDDLSEDLIPTTMRDTINRVVLDNPSGDLPFVGRKAELYSLHRALISSSHGVTIAAVTGQPGIGKSALCSRFLRGAVGNGATALYSRAYPADRNVGYRSLLAALYSSPQSREQITSIEEPWQGVIQSLSDGKSARTSSASTDVEKQEFIFEAFTRVLQRTAKDRSLILWIDDVHWADPSTIGFLEYLSTRRQKLKVCVLLSLRDTNARHSQLTNVLESADALVHVGRLSRREVIAVVTRAPRNKRQTIGRELWRLTGGHPYLITEIFLSIPLNAESWSARAIREVASSSISQLITTKIESLEAGQRALLNALAVFNKPVSTHVIRKVVALRRSDLLTSLDELLERNLIRDENRKLSCAHDLIREAVYLRLSSTQKQLLHRFCANALEVSAATPREIIDHLLMAKARKQVYIAALRAASESTKHGAYKETDYFLSVAGRVSCSGRKRSAISWRRALNAFEAGNFTASQRQLSVLDRIPTMSTSLRYKIRELRLRIGRLSGRVKPAELMCQARALAEATDAKELIEIHCLALRSCTHVILATGGTADEVETTLSGFAKIAEKYPTTPAALFALTGATHLHIWLGQPAAAEALMAKAVNSLTTCRSASVRSEVLLSAATVKYFNGELQAAKQLSLQAVHAADQAFSMRKRTVALITLSAVSLDLGEYSTAASVLDEIINNSSSNEKCVPELALAHANYSLLHLDKGELELAAQSARECLRLGESIEHGRFTTIPLAVLGICALGRGSIAEAKKCRQGIYEITEEALFDDVLVIEQFLRRLSELERDYDGARKRLESRIEHSSRYNLCCRTGLKLELARVCLHTDPSQAFHIACEQLAIATQVGARSLIDEAEAIMARARLKSIA